MRYVYISSNAFPNKNLGAILNVCEKLGIKRLELGSGCLYTQDAAKKIKKAAKSMNILLHNYIPAPKTPFVLNLASNDRDVLKKSMNLVSEALEISSDIGAAFYAVHSGFAYFAEPQFLGGKQSQLEHFPMADAEEIFVNSINNLSTRAGLLGVKLLIENNAMPKYNLINGKNISCLMVDIENSAQLLKKFKKIGVSLLLDAGHLQVSAKSLGFNKDKYVKECSKYIYAIHANENDLSSDQHRPLHNKSWALGIIKSFPERTVTVEVDNNLEDGLSNIKLIERTC